MRILVAEDDVPLADFLCQELQKEQFAVQVVANGIEAQKLALNQHYDLVILDLGLPGAAGLEVLRGIRSPKPDLPVLMVTAAAKVEERVRWMQAPTTMSRNRSFSPSSPLAFARSCGVAAVRRAPFCKSRISSSSASPTLSNAVATKSL